MRKICLAAIAGMTLANLWVGTAYSQSYIQLHGGTSILRHSELDPLSSTTSVIEAKYGTGYLVGGTFGYSLGSLRLEAETTYRSNPLKEISTADASINIQNVFILTFPGQRLSAQGDFNSFAVMANGWYDFRNSSSFTPYIGGGIGAAYMELTDLSFGSNQLPDDSDTVWAGQIGTGIAYAITSEFEVSLDYRFMTTTKPKFKKLGFKSEYLNHSVHIGFRFRL